MGASLPVASGVAKLRGRKSTRRGGDGQSSGCSCLPAGPDCASREFCPERAPAVPPAEGSILVRNEYIRGEPAMHGWIPNH